MPVAQSSIQNEASAVEPSDYLNREHTWCRAIFIACGLSLSITVDILQYSMPLAFLPSVLEDRGHGPMKIATAIGVYYWTGFLGCTLITAYQVWAMVCNRGSETGQTVARTRQQIVYVIGGLVIGTITLFTQALYPHLQTHTVCRFIQGFAGAFIFFYTFLLSVAMFKGEQQVFAMTAAATALNMAEVLGSTLGAVIFDYYGQRTVFWFLGFASVLNQVVLVAIICMIRGGGSPPTPPATEVQPLSEEERTRGEGWGKLWAVVQSRRLACAVILIAMAAIVKGSVEEILPFHADHRWGFGPMEIGQLFSIIAVAYITAAVLVGRVWVFLNGYRVTFSALWLPVLGVTAWCVFITNSYSRSEMMLRVALAFYGACLGFTHTPAALLLADAVEHEEGKAKDAVNGIWNTMWEAGGSLGFLLGGLLAENYNDQVNLMTAYVVCCILAAGMMLAVANWPTAGSRDGPATSVLGKLSSTYGSTKEP
jgi:MFS family permease